MPLRNRVTPLSELIAVPERGLLYGNRGVLHDEQGDIVRAWQVRRWIACLLEFRGWYRSPVPRPGRFTGLFFLDEATAFAAGHRPCALCRRADYDRFVALWRVQHPEQTGADAIDLQLHGERVGARTRERRLHETPFRDLPDGALVLLDGAPWLVRGGDLRRWTPGGYAERRPRPARGEAAMITAPSLAALLAAGWQPLLHPTALDPAPRSARR